MLHEFSYRAPCTLEELFHDLDVCGQESVLLAGGTDVLVSLRLGMSKPRFVVDVKKVSQLSGIEKDGAWLGIGATTTINELIRSPLILSKYPLLALCGKDLASHQIRNRATIAGNIVNASPCSDMAPGLLCLGAHIEILSKAGLRVIPLEEFFLGVKKTVLAHGEVVSRILVPLVHSGSAGRYRKLKRIHGHDLGIIGVAVAVRGDGISLAISSAAPTPACTGILDMQSGEAEILERVRKVVNPISDVRCTKEYRQFMIETFVKRLLKEVRS